MRLTFEGGILTVTREATDKKLYTESALLHAVKKELNEQGYDLIKKLMWKDGHLVSDTQHYLRTRKKGAGKADVYIYHGSNAICEASEPYNQGEVVLNVDYGVFK
jgi:hypothetical protein